MSYFEYEPSGIDEMEIVPFYLNIVVLSSEVRKGAQSTYLEADE